MAAAPASSSAGGKKTVLVFGASGAIGGHISKRFSENDWRVIGTTRKDDAESGLLTFDPFAKNFDDNALDALGPFDAVVWAQGANANDSLYDIDIEKHKALYEANCLFIMASLQLLLKRQLLAAPAKLCVISSIWQNLARQNKLSYCVTKAALQGLVLSAAADLARDGHLINAVLPGVLDTPMTRANLKPAQIEAVEGATQFRRLPALDDVAGAVLFLCSPQNTGLTGQFIEADLGFSHVRIL